MLCTTGGQGHVQPLRPLAQALRASGHPVAWVTAPDALARLQDLHRQGVELYAAGPGFEPSRQHFRQAHGPWLNLSGEALSAEVFPRLFGATLAPAMWPGIDAAIAAFEPGLVIHEPAALAAPLVCQRHGLPAMTHAYGLPVPASQLHAALRWLAPAWQAAGRRWPAERDLRPDGRIEILPDILVPPHPDGTTQRLNAFANGPARTVGRRQPLTSPRASPRAYLSFGTVFNQSPVLPRAAQALLAAGCEVLLTLGGDIDTAALPAHPRLRVERFVDQADALARCDLVVSHGGAGTAFAAAAFGRPQIVLPQAADHFRNARALAQAAGALSLEPDRQTLHEMRDAALWLLGTPPTAADLLAEAMRGLPTAVDAVAALERRYGR